MLGDARGMGVSKGLVIWKGRLDCGLFCTLDLFIRLTASDFSYQPRSKSQKHWIPAFAGMTGNSVPELKEPNPCTRANPLDALR